MKQHSTRNKKGQATIEMAFTMLFFLVALFVLADLTRITYNWMVLQFAVNEGARFGSLGRTDSACDQNADIRGCSIQKKVTDTAKDLGVEDVNVHFGDSGSGQSSEFFTLVAFRNLNVNSLTGLLLNIAGDHGKIYHIEAITIIRNEPF